MRKTNCRCSVPICVGLHLLTSQRWVQEHYFYFRSLILFSDYCKVFFSTQLSSASLTLARSLLMQEERLLRVFKEILCGLPIPAPEPVLGPRRWGPRFPAGRRCPWRWRQRERLPGLRRWAAGVGAGEPSGFAWWKVSKALENARQTSLSLASSICVWCGC